MTNIYKDVDLALRYTEARSVRHESLHEQPINNAPFQKIRRAATFNKYSMRIQNYTHSTSYFLYINI